MVLAGQVSCAADTARSASVGHTITPRRTVSKQFDAITGRDHSQLAHGSHLSFGGARALVEPAGGLLPRPQWKGAGERIHRRPEPSSPRWHPLGHRPLERID